MKAIPIFTVDAFTDIPYSGNPNGVCILDKIMPDKWMQNVAEELKLSDTAFLLKKGHAEYDLRWFTPELEVDLCGSATLASAHILWELGIIEKDESIVFNTKSGILSAESVVDGIILDFPIVETPAIKPPDGLLKALNLDEGLPAFDGNSYTLVEIDSAEKLLAVAPDFGALKKVDTLGVIVTAKGSGDVDFVSRFFAPAAGFDEDPVTGSAHTRLANYWSRKLGKTKMRAKQLSRRGGSLMVEVFGDRVKITGKAVTVIKGELCY